jgi:hypothetical protein
MTKYLKYFQLLLLLIFALLISCNSDKEGPTNKKNQSHIVFMIGEGEYKADEILLPLIKQLEEEFNFQVSVIYAPRQGSIPDLELLDAADLLVLYIRFRQPPDEQIEILNQYFKSGKPAVALRTTSHAFWGFETKKTMSDVDNPEDLNRIEGPIIPERLGWFPPIFGGNYLTHPDHALGTKSIIPVTAIGHPILRGISGFTDWGHGGTYISQPLENTVSTLLLGKTGDLPADPIAWTNTYTPNSKLFYTCLGTSENLNHPSFKTLVFNAIFWGLDMEIPETGVIAGESGTVPPFKSNKITNPPVAKVPDDAILLFNGTDLDKWQHYDLGMKPFSINIDDRAVSRIGASDFIQARWSISEGSVVAAPGLGDIITKKSFTNYELHLDFLIPDEPEYIKEGFRGSSGIYIGGRYEIQISNSHGTALTNRSLGAIYDVKSPDRDASLGAGEWQTFDITHRYDSDGKSILSVRLNGKLIHDNVIISDPTEYGFIDNPQKVANKYSGLIRLQADASQVRFANIWLREQK